MPVRRWLSGERDIKSLISNFDKSFTKLGIENNIRKYEPPKRKPDPSILGTDDEKVTQPATSGIEPDNQDDALDLGKEYQRMAQSRTQPDLEREYQRMAQSRTQPDLEREYQRMAQSRTQPTKTSSATVRTPTDYEEFDASPDPRARNPKTFRGTSPTYTPIQSTSKYEPEDTDRLDTGSRSSVNYNQQDIQNINNLASRSSENQPKPKLATALKEPQVKTMDQAKLDAEERRRLAAFTRQGTRKQPATTSVTPSGLNFNGLKSSNNKLIFPQEPGKTTSNKLNPKLIN